MNTPHRNTELRRIAALRERAARNAALVAAGLDTPECRREINRFREENAALRALRAARRAAGVDPLLRAAVRREKLAIQRRARAAALNKLGSWPISAHWRRDWREKIVEDFDTDAAIFASIEALCRMARRWGYRIYHTSRTDSRATSRYLVNETGRRVRVSDHQLPWTPERAFRDDNGGPSWDDDVVVNANLLHRSIDRWREIIDGTE